jgi:hypothetical protein
MVVSTGFTPTWSGELWNIGQLEVATACTLEEGVLRAGARKIEANTKAARRPVRSRIMVEVSTKRPPSQ